MATHLVQLEQKEKRKREISSGNSHEMDEFFSAAFLFVHVVSFLPLFMFGVLSVFLLVHCLFYRPYLKLHLCSVC